MPAGFIAAGCVDTRVLDRHAGCERLGGPQRLLRDRQYDFADVALCLEGGLRSGELLQWKGLGNQRLHLLAFDALDELAEDLRLLDRAAEEAQILEIERSDIQLDDRSGNGAGNGVAAFGPQDVEKLWPLRPSYQIDDDVDAARPWLQVVVRIPVDNRVSSAVTERLRFGGARHCDHVRAARFGELDRRRAEAPDEPVTKTVSPTFTFERVSMFSAVE